MDQGMRSGQRMQAFLTRWEDESLSARVTTAQLLMDFTDVQQLLRLRNARDYLVLADFIMLLAIRLNGPFAVQGLRRSLDLYAAWEAEDAQTRRETGQAR
jgi:hypothetical protein